MGRSIPTVQQIERVFHLAYFITGRRGAALQIAADAAEGWEVTCRQQRKRPRSKKHPENLRQKLIMNDEHALQFLTYKLCEPEEKAQESKRQDGVSPVHPHFFVIRYIKHLLYQTVSRRSFHVALGLCRLLYDYPKGETVEVYDTISQKDYRLEKDEQMYKDWKKFLLLALRKRFSGLLLDEKGRRGAARFVSMSDQGQVAGLVMSCLELFAPWGTSCELPDGQKPGGQQFKQFKFTGRNPDKEYLVEERRMYALINPLYFAALTDALRLGPPCDRLSVPLFSLPKGGDEPPLPPDPRNLHGLTGKEMFDIANYLTRNRSRRETSHARPLSVEVEGVERTTIDTRGRESVRLVLEEDDDLLQVFTDDGDGKLLLTSLLLSGSGALEGEEPWRGLIKLPRGKELRIVVIPPREHDSGAAGAVVEIKYREARPFFRLPMTAPVGLWAGLTWGRVLIPASVLALVIAAALLFGPLRRKENQQSHVTQTVEPEQVVSKGEPPPANNTPPPVEASTGAGVGEPNHKGSPRVSERRPVSKGNKRGRTPAQPERVAAPGVPPVDSLTDVRRVFVSPGRSESERLLRDALVEALGASGRFTVVERRKMADATLSGELVRGGTVTVQLVSSRREVMWHKVVRVAVGDDPSSARAAAADIVRTLLNDDESLKRLRGAPHP